MVIASIPARTMNNICPAGRENMIWDHTRVSFSTKTMSRSFDWTDKDSRWELQWLVCCLIKVLLKDFFRERTELFGNMDERWTGRMFRHPCRTHSLFLKTGSQICSYIFLRLRSLDMCIEAISLSLAFAWT